MGVRQLTQILPYEQVKRNYLQNKSIAIDFYNFLFMCGKNIAYELLYNDNIEPMVEYFKDIVCKIHEGCNNQVFLIIDGEYLPGKAPISLLRILKREEFMQTDQYMKNIDETCVQAMFITQEQENRLLSSLISYFIGDNFQIIRAPTEADFQIQYMVDKGLITCILSNDSDFSMLGVEVIQNFNARNERLVSSQSMENLYCQFGGKQDFQSICILKGNDYFQGFRFSFQQIFGAYKANNFDLLNTAFQLNRQKYIMSDAQIVKAIFLSYALEIYCTIFDFESQTVKHLNQIHPDDEYILNHYYQPDILGKLHGQEVSIKLISCYQEADDNIESPFIQKYEHARSNDIYFIKQNQNVTLPSILSILKLEKQENNIYKHGNICIDFNGNSYHVDFLLRQSSQHQQLFNFQKIIQD